LIVADTANQVIRRIDAGGTIATIAGSGARGPAAKRTRAASARFSDPSAVAIDQDGSVLVTDTGNGALRRIDVRGTVTTIARQAPSSAPTDVAIVDAGEYAVADTGDDRVVLVSAGGRIAPLAGDGKRGFSGDGGPASQAELSGPTQISPSAAGLLIADTGNRVIRRIGLDGIIVTVAGRPPGALPGGTPAARLNLERPTGVAATADGGFVVSDVGRVWAVAPDGTVRPLAGTGQPGFTGDSGMALSVRLDHPRQMAVGPDGAILVADTDNDRIRRISVAGGMETVAGSDEPNIELAPVLTAPLRRPSATPRPGKAHRPRCARSRRCRYRVRGGHSIGGSDIPSSVTGGLSGGASTPACVRGATSYNYLKIRPYTRRLIRSASRPVIIRFGTSVDARITSFALRGGTPHGRRTVQVVAGPGTIRLHGALPRGSYVAVIEGEDKTGVRRCDSRKLRVVR
jgi:sugar lactone lactonase YvrE